MFPVSVLAHGGSLGVFDEVAEVVFAVAMVLGFRLVLRALGVAEGQEQSSASRSTDTDDESSKSKGKGTAGAREDRK